MSEAIALGRFPEASKDTVSLQQAARVWVRVALLSFGGPAGQIAVMHRILVEEKAWKKDFCTRSTIACSCPARRRSNLRPISAG